MTAHYHRKCSVWEAKQLPKCVPLSWGVGREAIQAKWKKVSSRIESVFHQLTKGVNQLRISSSNNQVEEQEHDDEEARIWHHIPHHVLVDHILIWLPIKSLLRFKCVSKLWYNIISSYSFASAHFKLCPFSQPSSPTQCLFIQTEQDYYLYCYDHDNAEFLKYYGRRKKSLVKLRCKFDMSSDKLFLVGTCNGLLCMASNSSCSFIIWNPTSLHYRKILDPYQRKSSEVRRVSWGFGYASSVDDYKVVRIIELPETSKIVVHLFSLRTNEWRRIGVDIYEHVLSLRNTQGSETGWIEEIGVEPDNEYNYNILFERLVGELVNETLHWIIYNGEEERGRKIVSFDLNLETFDEYTHLQLRSGEAIHDDFLCVMGGCLSALGGLFHDGVSMDMVRSPGVTESMFLLRDMNLMFYNCKGVVGFTSTGKFFILHRNNKLGLVDPLKKCTTLVTFQGSDDVQIANFVPSLVSFSSTGYLLAE